MKFLPLLLALFLVAKAPAAIKTESVNYKHGGVILEGYLAYDDTQKGKRPGLVVVHDWMGVGPYVKMRAEQLAKLGYVAFAVDMYGKGVRPTNAEEASKEAGKLKADRTLMRERVKAGLEILKGFKQVDTKKVAAMGYCFGGTTALELMRSGADISGVVSFHGGLDAPLSKVDSSFKGKVLAMHGADDPYVKAEEVAAFQTEMRDSKLDWEFVSYGNAVHSFTNKSAGDDNSKGQAYNEKADKRSWEAMKDFFTEIFAKG